MKGAAFQGLKGVEVAELPPEMLFNLIPVTYLSSGSRQSCWGLTGRGRWENSDISLKTLTLKLLALLLGIVIIVIVILNHKDKKDKSIGA